MNAITRSNVEDRVRHLIGVATAVPQTHLRLDFNLKRLTLEPEDIKDLAAMIEESFAIPVPDDQRDRWTDGNSVVQFVWDALAQESEDDTAVNKPVVPDLKITSYLALNGYVTWECPERGSGQLTFNLGNGGRLTASNPTHQNRATIRAILHELADDLADKLVIKE